METTYTAVAVSKWMEPGKLMVSCGHSNQLFISVIPGHIIFSGILFQVSGEVLVIRPMGPSVPVDRHFEIPEFARSDLDVGEPVFFMREQVLRWKVGIKLSMDTAQHFRRADIHARIQPYFFHKRLFCDNVRPAKLLGVPAIVIVAVMVVQGLLNVRDKGSMPFDEVAVKGVDEAQLIPEGLGRFKRYAAFQACRGCQDFLGEVLERAKLFALRHDWLQNSLLLAGSLAGCDCNLVI
ncbi:hypothetical protein AWY79_17970 [Pseudodesulfovibrio indicus]|uniref:Uncharacterized protein n=1 Tax=Pseudodesulfovibrio indicus TaxID=1716143 RepID=A0ABN4M3E2_9BACT|nr:hypothetical protein AWY79_17970 [Pseudodesulfovibrio indicus]